MREILLLAFVVLLFGCAEQPEGDSNLSAEQNDGVVDNTSISEIPSPEAAEDKGPALKVGCDYGNPSCPANYECVNSSCVLDLESSGYSESCKECLDESPGYVCADDRCVGITPDDCDEGECCAEGVCVEKQGCYYGNPECRQDEICLSNNCLLTSALLPSNSENSENCRDNEVYVDGACAKAAYTLHFLSNNLTPEQFDEVTEQTVAAFVYNTPLRGCPDRLRVHKTVPSYGNISCDYDFTSRSEDVTIYFINSSNKNCSYTGTLSTLMVPYIDPPTEPASAMHELGHTLGLWDQYCYWPVPGNPNPADYEKGKCRTLREGEYFFNYCSREGRLPEGMEPSVCRGNPNLLGGVTIMGITADPSTEYTSHPQFGFTKEEYEVIAEKLSCG